MNSKIIKLFCFLLITNLASAQDYAVSKIPDSLLQNANVVKRFEELTVEIKDIDKAVFKHKYAYTILNEKGARFAYYFNGYDKLRKLSGIDGKLFDASGKELKSLKRKDIIVESDNDDSFLSDEKIKYFSFQYNIYPYTVEYENEIVFDGIYQLYPWIAVDAYNMSVQQSKLVIKQPKNYQVRLKFTGENYIQKTVNEGNQVFVLQNFKALQNEPFAPDALSILPNIKLAPSDFSIAGYTGNMDTWEGLGKFHLELNKGRNDLPNEIKKAVHDIADNKSTIEEKVKAIYEYMQSNTRYISIQLGIGGWQPLPASFVAQKKYGDCKALSNYMVSMLQEAGVKASYVIIKSDKYERNGLSENFPTANFNHIVCCVPNGKDSIWLECTSQTLSAGYMGTSTGNKKALLVNDEGGHVVNTPKFNLNNDFTKRTVNAVLNTEGKITIKSNTIYSGTEQERPHGIYSYASEEEKKSYYNEIYNLPNYSITKITLKEQKGRVPIMQEDVEIEAENYAAVSGKRMFIVANLFSREPKLPNDKPRTYPIVYTRTYRDIDTINIEVPKGYTIESMPKPLDVTNEFGKYKIEYSLNNGILKVTRLYEQEVNTFPANSYNALVAFYDVMYKADRAKIVLVKKEDN